MKKVLITFCILLIVFSILVGCNATNQQPNKQLENKTQSKSKLPSNFTIHIASDSSSSAQSSGTKANLTFKEGKIDSGILHNYSSDRGIESQFECFVDVQKLIWVDRNGYRCGNDFKFIPHKIMLPDGGIMYSDHTFPPILLENLQKIVDNDDIIKSSDPYSCHFNVCYDIEQN